MGGNGALPLDPRAQLELAPRRARAWLAALALGLPLAIIGGSIALGMDDETPLALAGAAGFCLLLFLAIDFSMRRHRIALTVDTLEVASTLYTRRLRLDELRVDRARIIDPAEHTGFKPLLRINGVGLPGFSSGWFMLRDRSRAFVAMAGGQRLLWLPTTRGFDLLLQPRQPQALLDVLLAMAPPDQRR